MMSKQSIRLRHRVSKIFAIAAIALTGFGAVAAKTPAAAGAFGDLAGAWSGNGTVTYASGTKERLRCKVKYNETNPDSVQQALRCASDSYKFEINAYYKDNEGRLSGHWDELTLQISGSITGTTSARRITGVLHGPGFSATVIVSTDGNEQTVTISSAEKDIREVAVRRSGS
jgi:hypothetical protein